MEQFKAEKADKFMKISCSGELNAAAAKTFSEQAKAWLLNQVNFFVIDFAEVSDVRREFYQTMIYLKTTLKKDQKNLYSLNLQAEHLKQIKSEGVEQAFNPTKSMDQVFAHEKMVSQQSNALNVDFINPFLTATLKTLDVQCRTKVKALKPFLKSTSMPQIAIAGVLPLMSNGFSGSIVLCFSQSMFLKIYENMFGEKHESISAELEDAAAELLNIIYGQAKIELNQKGYNFDRAFPTILTGEKIVIRQSSTKPAVVLPFESEYGAFHIEIEFNKTAEATNV